MKNWYSIKLLDAVSKNSAEIDIFDEIGYPGIRAADFIRDLGALGNVRNIRVRINSVGGDVFDGLAIFNALKRHQANITVEVYGLAASIASVIAMAGDKIIMPANTYMFIHDPLALVVGDAEDMRNMAADLEKIATGLIGAYVAKTGKDAEVVKQWMAGDTWFTAAEALEAGLADEVVDAQKIAAYFDLSKFRNTPPELLKPPAEQPSDNTVLTTDEIAEIQNLCRSAGHAHMAKKYIDDDQKPSWVRDRLKVLSALQSERQNSIEILKICEASEKLHLAADFIARGLNIEEVRAEIRNNAVDEVKEIYKLCTAADVADLAPKFIDEGRSLQWVQDRLKNVADIRARCIAAKEPERAAHFIRAGVTPDEAGEALLALMIARDPTELVNRNPVGTMPDRMRPTGINPAKIMQNYREREGAYYRSRLVAQGADK